MGALFGGVSDNAIESDGSEQESEDAEAAGEIDDDAFEDVAVDVGLERGDVVERKVGIEVGDGLLNGGGVVEWIAGDAEMEDDFAAVGLPERDEDERGWIVNEAAIFAVGGHADDGEVSAPELDLPAEGVL